MRPLAIQETAVSLAIEPQTGNRLLNRRRIRLARLAPVCLLLLLAASGAVYFRALLWGNNLHTVATGEVYRSAQPSADELEGYSTRLGLRTVVSLRGGKDHWPWFAAEKAVCDRHGVALQVVHFDPNRLPPKGELERLVQILDSAPRPLLLHCRRGIDRTGLGSAVALLLKGSTPEHAAHQFAVKFGYFAAVGHSDLPQVLSDYEGWLRLRDRKHAPAAFRRWVSDVYVPYFYRADIRLCPGCPEDADPLAPDRALEPGTWEVAPDKPLRLHFQLTNTSPEPWQFRSTRDHGVHLGLIVERVDGVESTDAKPASDRRELRSGYQDLTVPAGQTVGIYAKIPPLQSPGLYRVTVDLVDESVTWFADMGSPPLQFELQVRDASPVGR
jgi:protein tyrosine phosphatase (PTP) superfamily phosphohydrolase (DUF442 family)